MLNSVRDEKIVSQAIELNEKLQKVLTRHDALLSCKSTSNVNHHIEEQAEEEEEAEQLVRRYIQLHGTRIFLGKLIIHLVYHGHLIFLL